MPRTRHLLPCTIAALFLAGWAVHADASLTYPADGTVFPPEFPPPTILWRTNGAPNRSWSLRVTFTNGGTTIVREVTGAAWRPDSTTWNAIKSRADGGDATLLLAPGPTNAPPLAPDSISAVRFGFAAEPVGAPICYREVPLPFLYAVKNPDTIRWRLANPGSDAPPPVVLENLPVCGNCHSFDARGRTLGMDVDYANDKGAYALVDLEDVTPLSRDRIVTWSDYRREDGELTFGLLSRVSPDGRYVISTVKDRSVFAARPDLAYSQIFFPIKGILAVYDRQTRVFAALPGADDPRFVQSNAEWSPDGRWVYFCRAEAPPIEEDPADRGALLTERLARAFTASGRTLRYDIWRVPFDSGRGGTPEPVPGASRNGRSNYFPKLSPDGRWLVSCQAQNYMLLQPDSELFLVPADGGEPRRMRANAGAMNSWHSWSPNGRWLAFATKARGPYTQIALAHVDADGRDSPPVFLENVRSGDRACNIPEFVNRPPDRPFRLAERFLDHDNYRRQGQVLLLSGDPGPSIALFLKALDKNAGDHEARIRLAAAYLQTGREADAERELRRLLDGATREPKSVEPRLLHDAHGHLALLTRRRGRDAETVAHYRRMLELSPRDVETRLLLALLLASRGDLAEAERLLREALRIEPNHGLAHMWLGKVLEDRGATREAHAELNAALQSAPKLREDWLLLGQRLLAHPSLGEEVGHFIRRYRERFPNCAEGRVLLAKHHLRMGSTADAIAELEAAHRADPALAWIPEKLAELRGRAPTPAHR